MAKGFRPAVAHLRTSSAAYSDKRQRAAIDAFAKHAKFTIVKEYYDAAVSGGDHVDQRPGFAEMLRQLAANGAKTIIVEWPDRFARDLAVSSPDMTCSRLSASRSFRIRTRLFHRGHAYRRFGAPSFGGHSSI